jgi:hypothetical protein
MTDDRSQELRRQLAETAALRQRAAEVAQKVEANKEKLCATRELARQLLETQSALTTELIHIAKNVRWGLALRYGQPHDVGGAFCWTIAREGISALTVQLKIHDDEQPATLWVFDPHCPGNEGVQSVHLKTRADAEASIRLVQDHLAVA